MTLRVGSIVMGASDVPRAVGFWCRALDYRPREEPGDTWAVLTPVSGDGPNVSIALSDTPVQDRPRVHLDLYSDDQPATVERLLGLGASRVDWPDHPDDADFVVLADPEGNRFCVIDKGETYLETARMRLRRLTADDGDALLALHSDPAVMRYLGPPATEIDMSFYTGLYDRHPGFGYWAAVEKATGAFLGWFLFRPPGENPPPGTIELGYRLHTAVWGRGFAGEGAVALVDKGFAELGVERVVADTMTVNTGSRRVMEKAGLRFVRTFRYPGSDQLEGGEHGDVEYALTREEWTSAGGSGRGAATRPR